MATDALNEDIVQLAWRLILGRNLDNQDLAKAFAELETVDNLRSAIVSSNEYKSLMRQAYENSEFEKLHRALTAELTAGQQHRNSDLLILQTCDRINYVPMLQQTSLTVLEYIKRHGGNYEIFVGLKRGVFPWHAIFNRIYKLDEYIRSGYEGWVLYIDADAYFLDFTFDLTQYVADKWKYAFIMTPSSAVSDKYWNINDGVFFANMRHPVCRNIVRRWKEFYDHTYSDDDYKRADKWDMILNDQTALHNIVKFELYRQYIYTEGTRELFNSKDARVIRQIKRENYKTNSIDTLDKRIGEIRLAVSDALEQPGKR